MSGKMESHTSVLAQFRQAKATPTGNYYTHTDEPSDTSPRKVPCKNQENQKSQYEYSMPLLSDTRHLLVAYNHLAKGWAGVCPSDMLWWDAADSGWMTLPAPTSGTDMQVGKIIDHIC